MYEARQNKEKVSRQIQVGERYGIQLRGRKLMMNNPQINYSVKQLQLINAVYDNRRWRSTEDFDNKHLTRPIPKTDQDWVNWRTNRWPGFIRDANMCCTLITGDLNQAILNGHFRDLNIHGNIFNVTVQCACKTVYPRNAGNPLSVNNIIIQNFDSVIIEGYYNNDNSNVINHLVQGV